MRPNWAALAVVISLAACSHDYVPPPLDVRVIGAVVGEIKEEVGIYQAIVQAERPPPGTPIPPAPPGMVCGRGLVDFDVMAVTAALTTKAAVTTSADIKLTVPLDPSATSTLAPSGKVGEVTTNSQVLTFNAYPVLPVAYEVTKGEDVVRRPVAFTLFSLRNALREAAYKRPCFSTVHDPGKDPDNTFVLGFEVVRTTGGGIALKLAVLDASFSRSREVTQGNTITVSFRPYVPSLQGQATGMGRPGDVRPGGDGRPDHTFGKRVPLHLNGLPTLRGQRGRPVSAAPIQVPRPEI